MKIKIKEEKINKENFKEIKEENVGELGDKKAEIDKKKVDKKKMSHSELRQDIITGDWVVIATGRAKRPEDFVGSRQEKFNDDISKCLFCDPEATGQEKDVLMYVDSSDKWTLRVFPNKYPAIERGKKMRSLSEGPYYATTGVGYHEIFVTKDHDRHLPDLEVEEVAEVIDAYSDRYLHLMKRKSVSFVSIFHNYGKEAGASISHPHSQLLAVPVISPYINLELEGAQKYKKSHKKCVYCTIIEYEKEKEENSRVIYENDDFIAMCPFASRSAFEVWVLPKKHNPYFERINNDAKLSLAEVLKKALASIRDTIGDPAYNFYIHTSPCDGKHYSYYHWHIEILPRTSTWAGFELETGIEISTIQPEVAAQHLREHVK
ncbi:galactose-1-phosphate uridylyltransferase [Patescibacteria group bacterium]